MDTPVEEAFDRLTRMAARLVGAPVSLVSLVDEKREFFKSSFGLPAELALCREIPVAESFCKHVIESKSPWVIDNACVDPIMKTNSTVTDLGICAYAGIPLTMPNGEVIGTFCVLDFKPRRWKKSQIALLQDLAASVMTEIELRMLSLKQTESMEVLTHDLKNPLSAIFLLTDHLERAATRNGNHPLAEALSKIRESSQRMRNVIASLVHLNHFTVGVHASADDLVDLGQLIQNTLKETRSIAATVEPGLRGFGIVRGQRDELELALTNLLTAAAEMIHGRGTISVRALERTDRSGLGIRVEVDHGEPILDEEILGLFDPDLGKGAVLRKGTKLGLFLAREIVTCQGGELRVARLPRFGAGETIEFELLLPKVQTDAIAA